MINTSWRHDVVDANMLRMHIVRAGETHTSSIPLILLHGWPEFWYVWHRNIPALDERHHVIAPDLRGFGATGRSDPPPNSTQDYVADIVALMDTLGLERVGLVGHDIGAQIAQGVALSIPERIAALFFFDCPYPGIGTRWRDTSSIPEIWYQSLHQLPWAADLIASSRENANRYFGHFLSHWAGTPDAFSGDLDQFIDALTHGDNVAGGFDWYRVVHDTRIAQMRDGPQPRQSIGQPAFCLWGGRDPVIRSEWRDGLDEYFSNITVEVAPHCGHFPFYEDAALANKRMLKFFAEVGS